MDTVFRYFAAVYASRIVALYVRQCRVIVTKMTGNAYVTAPVPALAQVTKDIDALDLANQAALKGPKGSAKARNNALLVVKSDMRQLTGCVQVVCDSDITHAQTIIESCGMSVAKKAVRDKADLAVKYGAVSGLALLIARAFKGRGLHGWQMSTDEKTWTDLPATTKASTSVTGLTPATVYYFRHRTYTKVGYSDWSSVVTFIAH